MQCCNTVSPGKGRGEAKCKLREGVLLIATGAKRRFYQKNLKASSVSPSYFVEIDVLTASDSLKNQGLTKVFF